MIDPEQFDYLIDAIRRMSTVRHDGERWVRYADLVAWLYRLVEINGELMRPDEVQADVHDDPPVSGRYVVVPLALPAIERAA